MGYEEGVEENRHVLPETLRGKVEGGKKLTGAERMLVEGLKEMEGEVGLEKEDRLGWLKG